MSIMLRANCPSPAPCPAISEPAPFDQPSSPSIIPPIYPGSTNDSLLSDSQKRTFVDTHNQYRNNTKPPASYMSTMDWSDNLAQGAQNWASKCNFSHSQTPGIGENIYATSRRTPNYQSFDPNEAVRSWGNEGIFYNYDKNSCEPGRVCGHYTQVVWDDTNKVGCGIQDCPSIQGINWPNGGTVVVCQYSPPGNYIGQKPYNTR